MSFISSFFQERPASKFLSGNFTLATLPAAASNSQMYAWVTDLHDSQPDLVISDGTLWKPVRPLAAKVVADSNAAMTFTCMANSPTMILRGTLTQARNITFVDTYAYGGAKVRFKREASGLLGINILGAVAASLGLNSWADMEYVVGTGWVQTASGGLL